MLKKVLIILVDMLFIQTVPLLKKAAMSEKVHMIGT